MTLTAAVVVAPVMALIHAFVVRSLWFWFAVPLGAPEVGYAHAYGLSLLVSVVTYQGDAAKDVDPIQQTIAVVVRSLLILVFGFIAAQIGGLR